MFSRPKNILSVSCIDGEYRYNGYQTNPSGITWKQIDIWDGVQSDKFRLYPFYDGLYVSWKLDPESETPCRKVGCATAINCRNATISNQGIYAFLDAPCGNWPITKGACPFYFRPCGPDYDCYQVNLTHDSSSAIVTVDRDFLSGTLDVWFRIVINFIDDTCWYPRLRIGFVGVSFGNSTDYMDIFYNYINMQLLSRCQESETTTNNQCTQEIQCLDVVDPFRSSELLEAEGYQIAMYKPSSNNILFCNESLYINVSITCSTDAPSSTPTKAPSSAPTVTTPTNPTSSPTTSQPTLPTSSPIMTYLTDDHIVIPIGNTFCGLSNSSILPNHTTAHLYELEIDGTKEVTISTCSDWLFDKADIRRNVIDVLDGYENILLSSDIGCNSDPLSVILQEGIYYIYITMRAESITGTYYFNTSCSTLNPTETPTNIPSESPTITSPSNAPSRTPSVFPTIEPTLFPTLEPTTPSVAPSTTPTDHPTLPTLAPTHSVGVLCGDHEWCYNVDIFLSDGNKTTETVAIAGENDDIDTYFHIQFTAKGGKCVKPTMSLSMEEIDFSSPYEYIDVLNDDNSTITRCTGSLDSNCGHWIDCLTDYSLGTQSILQDDTYTITIHQPFTLNAKCQPIHSYSVNVALTITCSDESVSPTYSPSSAPTFSPSKSPTSQPSQSPTTAPSLSPTHIPVNLTCDSNIPQTIYSAGDESIINQYTMTVESKTDMLLTLCNWASWTSYGIIWMKLEIYNEDNDPLTNPPSESTDTTLCNQTISQSAGQYQQILDPGLYHIKAEFYYLCEEFHCPYGQAHPYSIVVTCRTTPEPTTSSPSNSPSLTPTLTPSFSPSNSPSYSPTFSPSATPSSAPTYSPSNAPSLSPTITPSLSPSDSPSYSPTYVPSEAPSTAPTIAPSDSPSFSPSMAPSLAPSLAPTYSPSSGPSFSPSLAPSLSPSESPSLAPSNAPSQAPTRIPTQSNSYDSYMEVTYNIFISLPDYIDYLAKDFMNNTAKIIELIEQGYVNHKTFQKDRWILEYRTFTLRLLDINGRIVSELANDNELDSLLTYFIGNEGLRFHSRLECSLFICNEISDKYDKKKFENKTALLLNGYFRENIPSEVDVNANSESDEIKFSVLSMGSVKDLDTHPPDFTSVIIGSVAGTIILLILWCIVYYYDVIKREIDKRKTIFIRNPMVIAIAIGYYKKDPTRDDIRNIGGRLKNLHGIRVDIEKVIKLFGKDKLKYDIHPSKYYEENVDNYKAYWDEDELIDFLKAKSDKLESNLYTHMNDKKNQYDGLMVIISCHGLKGCILTSDYQKIDKAAIHRIFSAKKPLSRKIPRIFLFDCCSGSGERDTDWRAQSNDGDEDEISSSEDDYEKGIKDKTKRKKKTVTGSAATDKTKQSHQDGIEQGKHMLSLSDQTKNTTVGHIASQASQIWMYGEDNPDFQLVTINAANDGFQSKMSVETGSYVITQFVDGIRNNLFMDKNIKGIDRIKNNIYRKHNDQFLYQILNKIQDDLHQLGKQLMVKTFNNNTEFIKFEVNNRTKEAMDVNDTDTEYLLRVPQDGDDMNIEHKSLLDDDIPKSMNPTQGEIVAAAEMTILNKTKQTQEYPNLELEVAQEIEEKISLATFDELQGIQDEVINDQYDGMDGTHGTIIYEQDGNVDIQMTTLIHGEDDK